MAQREFDLGMIEKADFMAWQVTTDCGYDMKITLSDGEKVYFNVDKPFGAQGFKQQAQGGLAYGGKGPLKLRVISDKAKNLAVFQDARPLMAGTVKIGLVYNFCFEDGDDDEYSDLHVHVVAWKKDEYPKKYKAMQPMVDGRLTLNVGNATSANAATSLMGWLVTNQSGIAARLTLTDKQGHTFFDVTKDTSGTHELKMLSNGHARVPYGATLNLDVETHNAPKPKFAQVEIPLMTEKGEQAGQIFVVCVETGYDEDYNDFCVVLPIWYRPT